MRSLTQPLADVLDRLVVEMMHPGLVLPLASWRRLSRSGTPSSAAGQVVQQSGSEELALVSDIGWTSGRNPQSQQHLSIATRPHRRICTRLTWCFPGRCTLTCSRRRFPVLWSSFLSAVGECLPTAAWSPSGTDPLRRETYAGTCIMKPLHDLVDERTFTMVSKRRATLNDALPSD